ncbi:N-6 DNA methylase [Nocardia higoensis]|uniref:N-6 DNA methylase n=1 Tax=Nocardia higoensis TaxID=228599 RepID=A0ABS0D556_9NOCA|nr:N-6 DNA methylase [Nocardia higoensis]MBF6353617.1 N-6 DNA methylase [Nocardia higoensis]
MTATEISKLVGVTRATVSNWRKRHEDFPKPVGGTEFRPVFDWNAVQAWLADRGQDAADTPTLSLQTELRSSLSSEDAQGLLAGLTPSESGWVLSEAATTADVSDVLKTLARAAEVEGPRAALQVLADHAHGGEQNVGLYRTPEPVATLMADLLEPLGAGLVRVLDPACGGGSLLAAAAARGATELYGQDISETQAALARLAVPAETGVDATIALGDSLHDDAFPDLAADAVLCSPLSGRDWGSDRAHIDDPRWAFGLPARTDSDFAWVQHALAHLRPGGLAVLLLPAFAASKASARRVRGSLLRAGVLRAVVNLPPRLPQLLWTRLNLQIWILAKPDPDTAVPDSVLLVDTAVGELAQSGAGDAVDWPPVADTVRRVWAAFITGRSAEAEEPNVSTVVRVVDLLDEEVDLSPGPRVKLAIDPGIVADEADTALSRLRASIAELTHASESVGRVTGISGATWRTATMSDLASGGAARIVRAQPSRSTASDGEEFRPAITGRDIVTDSPASGKVKVDSDSPTIDIETGDILVPTVRGSRGHVFRIAGPEEAGLALGPNVQLVRTDPQRLDPWFVAGFIGGLDDVASGGTTLIHSALQRTRIPLLPLAQQQRYGAAFRDVHQLRAALARAGAAVEQIAEVVTTGLVAGALEPAADSARNEDMSNSRGGSE